MEFKSKGIMHRAFKIIKLPDGTVIGIFQGVKGDKPELDIRICYKDKYTKGAKRTPKHIHWTIDLLIKKEHNKELTMRFIKYLREMWDKLESLKTKQEQLDIDKKLFPKEDLKEFEELNKYGDYSVDFIAYIIELFVIEEKTSREDAFMFKDLFDALLKEKDIFYIVSKATHNGRL